MDTLRRQLEDGLSDRFRVVRTVGKGGMATVYLADQYHPSRPVAIKVLDPDISSIITRTRFLREVDMAGNLVHPNIVPIYSAGQIDDLLYCVMPFIEGRSLRSELGNRGAFKMEEAITIASEAAAALAFAHERGIVHRDIKPENILVADGHAMVTDFGIAKAYRDATDLQLTRAGVALGTPAYMSPEQARGTEICPESDIYSLGCVLYEMISGRAPFTGDSAREIMKGHTSRKPPRLRSPHGPVPRVLSDAVSKCLEKKPEKRFRDGLALASAIQNPAVFDAIAAARRRRLGGPAAWTAASAIGLALAVGIWRSETEGGPRPLLVATLENQTGSEAADSVGFEFARQVVRALRDLGVPAVFRQLPPDRETLLSAARTSGARAVVHGSYYLIADSLSFQVVVTSAEEGTVLAAPPPQSAVGVGIGDAAAELAGSVARLFRPDTATGPPGGLGSDVHRE